MKMNPALLLEFLLLLVIGQIGNAASAITKVPEVVLTRRTWIEARKDCNLRGGDLLSEQSWLDMGYDSYNGNTANPFSEFLKNDVPAGSDMLWIGMNDRAREGRMSWSDSSAVDNTFWNSHEPNNANGREDCAVVYTDEVASRFTKWNDVICHEKRQYICWQPANNERAITKVPEVIETPRNWVEARDDCRSRGGDLLSEESWLDMGYDSYDSASRNPFTNFLKDTNFIPAGSAGDMYWIGLSDREHEGWYQWSDGTEFVNSKWNSHEPNNANGVEDCVVVYSNEALSRFPRWNDLVCHEKRHYICWQPIPVPGPTVAGPTVAGPTVAGPTVAGPTVAGPTVAGPTVAGPTVAGPTVAGPTVAGPTVAAPTETDGTETDDEEAELTTETLILIIVAVLLGLLLLLCCIGLCCYFLAGRNQSGNAGPGSSGNNGATCASCCCCFGRKPETVVKIQTGGPQCSTSPVLSC